MPDNVTEFLWWALNGSILIVVWFAQKKLANIEKILERLLNGNSDHENRIVRLEVRCGLYHGEEDHPMRRATDIASASD